MKTIQSRFTIILAIFLFLSIVGSVITIYSQSKQKADGVIINLAGKQRMLTQKMSKESLALSHGIGSKESLEKTIILFDKILKGLISGDSELGLPATENIEIVNQLNFVQTLWKYFRANLNVILVNSLDTTTALSYLNNKNITLLKEINTAVDMMDRKGSDPAKINLAGRQRMLTQKMAKEAIAISQGLGSSESLEETANLFDKTLNGMIFGDSDLMLTQTKDRNILRQLNHVKELWKDFRINLDDVVAHPKSSATALSYINDNNLDLLKESHKIVTLLESNSISSKTINLAGKQRMLTLKMIKETLGLVQGSVDVDSLKSTVSLFDKTLKGLISGDSDLGLSASTDSAILAQLMSVQRLWEDFYGNVNTVMELAPEMNNAIAYINGHNEELLKEMNKAVRMYEKYSKEKVAITSWVSVVIVGVVIITVVLTWLIIVRPLMKTLNNVIGRVDDIAKGDLENKLDINRNDEIGKLSVSINQMSSQINTKTIEQETINKLLRLNFEPLTLNELMDRALDEIFSIPWKSFQAKGTICLAEEDNKKQDAFSLPGASNILFNKCSKMTEEECLCKKGVSSHATVFVCERSDISSDYYSISITSKNRLLGILNLYSKDGYQCSQDEEKFLETITQSLAGIIEKALTDK